MLDKTLDRSGILARLAAALGPGAVLTDAADMAPFATDWRGLFRGEPFCVLRPAGVAAVAAAVGICTAAGLGIVPQGGNTSLVGGATPDASGRQVVLSLARMNRVRAIDAVDMTMTVDAGVVVRQAQEAAEAAGCLFPLSFGGEGSAMIGGVLSTNAGGNNTVRFGNARELMLGLEVVLPDGRVWDGLRALRKDNTGYALRHLFVGAEGTLGIITGAVLKLVPRPRRDVLAFCAIRDAAAALALFRRFRDADEGCVRAFEYMSGASVELVLRHISGATLPLAAPARHYAIVDLVSWRADETLRALAEDVLGAALAAGEILDATIAENVAQQRGIWRLREETAEAQMREGDAVRNDVSVPVSRVPDFLREAEAACLRVLPGLRPIPFGHIGDGNVHMNLLAPPGMSREAFMARTPELYAAVNAVAKDMGGSFSAEHGVGRLKAALLPGWKGGVEFDLMRQVKRAIDPEGRLNPGKVFA